VTVAVEHDSTARVLPTVRPRKLAKVPFLELADGRLQGVVSSGSDVERVYVSSFAAGTHAFSCATNNNRPCGGAYGSPCKHLESLAGEAILQYGAERVARYLGVDHDADLTTGAELVARMHPTQEPAATAAVFSRFLRHLGYLELPGGTDPLPELHWFPAWADR
jgi:hypothetical protein